MQIFRDIPFFSPQNDTLTTVKHTHSDQLNTVIKHSVILNLLQSVDLAALERQQSFLFQIFDPGEEHSPATSAGTRTREPFNLDSSPAL